MMGDVWMFDKSRYSLFIAFQLSLFTSLQSNVDVVWLALGRRINEWKVFKDFCDPH